MATSRLKWSLLPTPVLRAASRIKKKATISYLTTLHRLPEAPVDTSPLPVEFSIITDDCYMPPHRMGGPDHDDMGFLLRFVRDRNPRIVLELGTAYGNTVANICSLLPEVRVITVNALPNQISGSFTSRTLMAEEIGRVYRRYGFDDQVEQAYANTLDVDLGQYLEHQSADIAIIDACHDPEYVENDFLLVEPFLRRGGHALLHDTHPSMAKHLAGSYLACLRLRRKGFDIQHVPGTWWGIWTNS